MAASLWKPLPSKDSKLHVKIPYARGNRSLIKTMSGAPRSRPKWDATAGHWLVSHRYFQPLLSGLQSRFAPVTLVVDSAAQEFCDKRCANAPYNTVWSCTCVCNGRNHAGSHADYRKEVGETLLIDTEYRRKQWVLA